MQAEIVIENGIISNIQNCVGYSKIISLNNGNIAERHFPSAFVFPGFTESHGHLLYLGEQLSLIDLSNSKSQEECAIEASKNPFVYCDWVLGRAWNQEKWDKNALPDKEILDCYFPDTPVFFLRVDYHAAWVNSKALEIAQINKLLTNKYSNFILKNQKGEPNGILLDDAIQIIEKYIPKYSAEQKSIFINNAQLELAKSGITTICDMNLDLDTLKLFNTPSNQRIKTRAYVNASLTELKKIEKIEFENFTVAGVKIFADGALGSYGAALLKPYSDRPDSNGFLLIEQDSFIKIAEIALSNNLDIAVHSIGDRAANLALKSFSELNKRKLMTANSKIRLEHCQIIDPDDLVFFSELPIFASVQPLHCTSDAMGMAQKRLGNRVEYSYLWKSLIENGATLLAGSDCPIESHNPFLGIDALVQRIPMNSDTAWFPKECLSRKEAINAYTINPASLVNSKHSIGSLSINSYADIVILNQDIRNCKLEDIAKTQVLATYVNGKPVFI